MQHRNTEHNTRGRSRSRRPRDTDRLGQQHEMYRPMLIDSGASCNFLDQTFADRLELESWKLPRCLKVRTADGSTIRCDRMLSSARITVPGYTGTHDFVIMPQLDGFDVVLGRAFLKASQALVCHATASVAWPILTSTVNNNETTTAARPQHISTNPWQPLTIADAHTIKSIASINTALIEDNQPALAVSTTRDHAEHTSNPVRDTRVPFEKPSNAANAPTKPPTPTPALAILDRVLERVALYEKRMQPKNGRLPPSRGEFDHRIELKDPNSRPVKMRSIPLNAEERMQLAIDIRELEEAGLIVRSESEWDLTSVNVDKDGGKARRCGRGLPWSEPPAEAKQHDSTAHRRASGPPGSSEVLPTELDIALIVPPNPNPTRGSPHDSLCNPDRPLRMARVAVR